MMAPIVQFNVMRTWSTEHGAGQVAAVLFEIEVPAPGVGWERQPTNLTGDRHDRRRRSAFTRAIGPDDGRPPNCIVGSGCGSHRDAPSSGVAGGCFRQAHGLPRERAFLGSSPAGRQRFSPGVFRRSSSTALTTSERLRPRQSAEAWIRFSSQRPISGGLAVVLLASNERAVGKEVRPLLDRLQPPQLRDRPIVRPLADGSGRNAEEAGDIGVRAVFAQGESKLDLGQGLAGHGATLSGLKVIVKSPKAGPD